ncbi:MAG: ATP-binding protein [Candidatus Omnitrophica bacterium]|nr:ATP-binding protein [Candidatus Omnitrophota bacterium]MDD5352291.1 ATP-binding protein [Candidatus Omnitrophota bacterium]MDD5549889.1 ATP-binding protein [Candidatus Omnitrophota bacterium]
MFIREQFVGREDVIKVINKRLSDLKEGYRQNIALLGDELTGKTWIIRFIFDNLSDPKIIPLYFDLSQATANTFTQRFFNVLLFNFLKTKGIILPKENTAKLIEEAKTHIPNTVLKIQNISSSNAAKDKLDISAFRDILGLLETLNQETGQKMVIIFDEFQNLEYLKIRSIFQEFGKKIMLQKNTMYIVLSSSKIRAKKIIQDELSLLFGNFETIDINNFDNRASNILIRNRLRNAPVSQDIINFLINFTGGNPFYLDKIAQHIYQNAIILKSDTISPFVFIYSLEEILFNKWGLLNLRFQNYIDLFNSKNKPDTLDLLLSIAQGKNKIKDLSSLLHKTYRDINQKLSKLTESNIIYRSGCFYNITDRVFNFWLNFVYLEKLNSISQNYDDQIISFRKKIEQSLLEFITISKKDIPQRLYELLTLFTNDSVRLGRNKILLSKFKEIEFLNFDGRHIKKGFICLSDDECWLIGFKDGDITEDCVCEFIKESKKIQTREKSLRRLIIGLDKTEINASLLAKEEKIFTWDIEHLNTLLDLYAKPRLII